MRKATATVTKKMMARPRRPNRKCPEPGISQASATVSQGERAGTAFPAVEVFAGIILILAGGWARQLRTPGEAPGGAQGARPTNTMQLQCANLKSNAGSELDLARRPVGGLERLYAIRRVRVDIALDVEGVEGIHIDPQLHLLSNRKD